MNSFTKMAYGFVTGHPGIGHRELANFLESHGDKNPQSTIHFLERIEKRIVYEARWIYLPEYKTTGKLIGYWAIQVIGENE